MEEALQLSVRNPDKRNLEDNPPQLWMPPPEALKMVLKLINWNISYMFTGGNHSLYTPELEDVRLFEPSRDKIGTIRLKSKTAINCLSSLK